MENERGHGGFSALCSFLRGPIRVGVWGCRRCSKLPCCIFPGLCRRSRVAGIELFFLLVLSLEGRQILIRTFVWKVWIICTCLPEFHNPWWVACNDWPCLIFEMSKPAVEDSLVEETRIWWTWINAYRVPLLTPCRTCLLGENGQNQTAYSLRASDSNGASLQLYGKNSIAPRGPVLWNILTSKDKHFSNTSYKNLKKKIRSMYIFKAVSYTHLTLPTICSV